MVREVSAVMNGESLCCGYRGGLVFEAHRLMKLNLRLNDLLGPVTRVKKKKKSHERRAESAVMRSGSEEGSYLRLIDVCITQL